MCSYIVKAVALPASSAKGPDGWMSVDAARVYFDHPFHSPLDHALGIDILSAADGTARRLALELAPEAARALAAAILEALAEGESEHGPAARGVPHSPPTSLDAA